MNDDFPAGETASADLVSLTADVVSAYIANNSLAVAELPGLVASVHAALGKLGQPRAEPVPTFEPAVPVKKSITPDAIISLIDGKPYKTLKRHLTGRGLTPTEYRQRYRLPSDYPMIAANYAARRSELAKSIGLGASRRKTVEAVEPASAASEPAKKRGGGSRKA